MLLCGSMRSGAPYLLDACSDSFLSHGILGREIVSSVLGVLTFPCTGLDSVSLICIIHCVGPRCFFSRYLLVYCISLWVVGRLLFVKRDLMLLVVTRHACCKPASLGLHAASLGLARLLKVSQLHFSPLCVSCSIIFLVLTSPERFFCLIKINNIITCIFGCPM